MTKKKSLALVYKVSYGSLPWGNLLVRYQYIKVHCGHNLVPTKMSNNKCLKIFVCTLSIKDV
jgi:hypothetical protein